MGAAAASDAADFGDIVDDVVDSEDVEDDGKKNDFQLWLLVPRLEMIPKWLLRL